MTFDDFVLQLGRDSARGFEVRAACRLAGEDRGRLVLPLAVGAVESRFAAAAHPRHRGAGDSDCDLGTALFESVFGDESVRGLLDGSLSRLDGEARGGLRIQIQIDPDDAELMRLHALPWELLHRRGEYLALSRRTPIVRYLELPRAVARLDLPPVVRVLALAPELRRQPALDQRSERTALEALARSSGRLTVDFVDPADLGALRRALIEKDVHVLHLMGHADFDPLHGRGVIGMERVDGGAEPVRAEALIAVVSDAPSLRLVVLNACNTGRAGGEIESKPFLAFAPALMRAGLPAVLAMQQPISDRSAIAFSQALYRHLAAGDPLEAAVAEGRQAIHARNPLSLEWAVPVLFLRASPPTPAQRPRGREHLRVGNYDEAIHELRQEVAEMPDRGLPRVALGVALGRGRPLRRLTYATAKEMHALFASALPAAESRGPAAAALLALKVDYFDRNAVHEPSPSRDVVLAALAGASWESEGWLLAQLGVSDETREALGARAPCKEAM